MKLQTVNVTEVVDSNIIQVFSFTDNPEGNKEAEDVFAELARKNGMEDEALEESLENGYWNDGGENAYNVFITHSS
jgi:hypothetical protein